MERTPSCQAKLDRMNKTLNHVEADRVPISDFFWGSFVERWREELGLPPDADIYRYYDLDWQVATPNLDPHIRPFEVLHESEEEVVVALAADTGEVVAAPAMPSPPVWNGMAAAGDRVAEALFGSKARV